ncbi:MAG: hypothetical protein GY774_00270 [Planctomycetes bacterium]|nr:hypothetical protein [Planctomycetota bacterium]
MSDADIIRITKSSRSEFINDVIRIGQYAECYNTDLSGVGLEVVRRFASGLELGQSHKQAGSDSTEYYFFPIYEKGEESVTKYLDGAGVTELQSAIDEGYTDFVIGGSLTVDSTVTFLPGKTYTFDGELFVLKEGATLTTGGSNSQMFIRSKVFLLAGTGAITVSNFNMFEIHNTLYGSSDVEIDMALSSAVYVETLGSESPLYNAPVVNLATGTGLYFQYNRSGVVKETGVDKTSEHQTNWVRSNDRINNSGGSISMEIVESATNPADDGVHLTGGKLTHGTASNPQESIFGGGNSYPAHVAYHLDYGNWSGTTITGAVDITEEAGSDSGSSFGLFGGTTVGSAILVGSDDAPFFGTKMQILDSGDIDPDNITLASVGPAGVLYEVKWMVTRSSDRAEQVANDLGTFDSEQWYFGGSPLGPSLWSKITLNINGVDETKYWGVMKVDTAIAQDMTLEQIKLHSSRTEFNALWGNQLFGTHRQDGQLLASGLGLITKNSLYDPANQVVKYGTTAWSDHKENKFANNRDDGFNTKVGIPLGTDTSTPLVLILEYYTNGNAGHFDFIIDSNQVFTDFVFDGLGVPNTQTIGVDLTSGPAYKKQQTTVLIDVEKLRPSDSVSVSIRRDGTAGTDTINSDIVFTDITYMRRLWF